MAENGMFRMDMEACSYVCCQMSVKVGRARIIEILVILIHVKEVYGLSVSECRAVSRRDRKDW